MSNPSGGASWPHLKPCPHCGEPPALTVRHASFSVEAIIRCSRPAKCPSAPQCTFALRYNGPQDENAVIQDAADAWNTVAKEPT